MRIRAKCPFHEDTQLSLIIDIIPAFDYQINGKCSSCNYQGNIIDFVDKHKALLSTNPNYRGGYIENYVPEYIGLIEKAKFTTLNIEERQHLTKLILELND